VIEYGQYLGIDVLKEPHLLWIAREGLLSGGFTSTKSTFLLNTSTNTD
jgi:hypothetical protein